MRKLSDTLNSNMADIIELGYALNYKQLNVCVHVYAVAVEWNKYGLIVARIGRFMVEMTIAKNEVET